MDSGRCRARHRRPPAHGAARSRQRAKWLVMGTGRRSLHDGLGAQFVGDKSTWLAARVGLHHPRSCFALDSDPGRCGPMPTGRPLQLRATAPFFRCARRHRGAQSPRRTWCIDAHPAHSAGLLTRTSATHMQRSTATSPWHKQAGRRGKVGGKRHRDGPGASWPRDAVDDPEWRDQNHAQVLMPNAADGSVRGPDWLEGQCAGALSSACKGVLWLIATRCFRARSRSSTTR